MIIWPFLPCMGWPSTSKLMTSSLIASSCRRGNVIDDAASVVPHHELELVAEVAKETLYRPGSGVAQCANSMSLDFVSDLLQLVEVLFGPPPLDDPAEHAVEPARAFAAGRALAAGLGHVETRDATQGAHHADGYVHHHHRPGAERGTGLLERVVVPGSLHDDVRRQHRNGRAAWNDGLQLASSQDAAAKLQQVAKRNAHRQLEVRGLLHMPGNGELRRTARPVGAETGKPGRPVADDRRHAREALGIVNGGGTSIQAVVRR